MLSRWRILTPYLWTRIQHSLDGSYLLFILFDTHKDMMATLVDLPTELLSHIAGYLVTAHIGYQDAGLRNFRLTCRKIRDKTSYDFTKSAFSTIKLDLHENSLASLHAFCRSPENCESVKRIVLAHDGNEIIGLDSTDEMDEKFQMTTVEEKVLVLLRSVFQDAFRRFANLKEVAIITPFAAVFRQWCAPENIMDIPCTDERMLNHVDDHLRCRVPVEECIITTNRLFYLLLEVATETRLELRTIDVVDTFRTYYISRGEANCRPYWSIAADMLSTFRTALQELHHLRLPLDADSVDHEF